MADSAQFLIDVSMQLTGENTITEIDRLQSVLTGAGASVGTFEKAIGQVSSALAEADAAAAASSAALANGETKYKQLEAAAVRAAKAVEAAGMKGAVPPDLQAKATATAAALKGEAVALDALKASAAAATGEQTKLKAALGSLQGAAAKAVESQKKIAGGTQNYGKVASNLTQLGGPLGTVGGKVFGLADAFGDLEEAMGAGIGGAVALVAGLTAAVVAVTVAIGAGIVKTAIWAVGLADVARNSGLTTAALETTSKSLVGLSEYIEDVGRNSSLTGDEIRGFAAQLRDAKVSAGDMPAALEAVATAETALGKGGSAKFFADLKAGKKTVGELAKEVDAKLGGIAADKMLGLSMQAKTLQQNLAETFGGLQIEQLLQTLAKVVGLFDQSTVAGRFMKKAFEGIFQPLVDAAVGSFPVIERFILQLAINATKLYLAFKPVVSAIGKLLGMSDTGLPDALTLATAAADVLAGAVLGVMLGVGALVAAVLLPVWAFQQLWDAGMKTLSAIQAAWQTAAAYLEGISLGDIGMSLVEGLADGITGGGSKVLDAITGVADSAVAAAKKALKIASPSGVFEEIGGQVGAGFEGGVSDSEGDAQDAMGDMMAPPKPGGAGGSAGASIGDVTIYLSVTVPPGTDGQGIAQSAMEVLRRGMRELLIHGGEGPVPA